MLSLNIFDNGNIAGSLSFDEGSMQNYTKLTPHHIHISLAGASERKNVEAFIQDTFLKAYDAKIQSHYPVIVSVHDENNKILAALGIRLANESKLFLEQYFDSNIDSIAGWVLSKSVKREEIVEVGNLASAGNGAAIFLFVALSAYFKQEGINYCVFTSTTLLHNYFLKLNLEPVLLGWADQSKLADAGASWGSYYKTKPRILIGDVKEGYHRLHHVLMLNYSHEVNSYTAKMHNSNGEFVI